MEKIDVQFIDEAGRKGVASLDKLPDECPQCHHKITPHKIGCYLNQKKGLTKGVFEVILKCPNVSCYEFFIAYYSRKDIQRNAFDFVSCAPKKFKEQIFPDKIKDISPDFCKIYNQSLSAEDSDLQEICGTGYRRALEFLIKDYLINKTDKEDEKEAIKNEKLGTCIKTRIEDSKIKEVAKRATWLGNDETHYTRKWEDKDLQDLKKLINLSVHWIEAEILTKELMDDMPEKKKEKVLVNKAK